MATVILIIHLMIAVTLVALVLLQRSEGGALGIGGGGGGGGLMSGRGVGNALTRATAVLAAIFFVTSLGLGILASRGGSGGSVLDQVAPAAGAPDMSVPGPASLVPAPAGSDASMPAPATTMPAVPAEPAAPAVPRAQ